MNQPWLDHYPPGVAAVIDDGARQTVSGILEQPLRRHALRPAITSEGVTTTYGELQAMAASMSAWLQAAGVEKGDRVAIMMPNGLPFVVSTLAVLAAGGVVVTVNPQYTARELEYQLEDSGARLVIVLDAFAPTLDAVLANMPGKREVVVARSGMAAPPRAMFRSTRCCAPAPRWRRRRWPSSPTTSRSCNTRVAPLA
jgi:long-chain acyl-CoA synthetase